MNLNNIFKNRKQILEGLENKLFKKEHVEQIAEERLSTCRSNECGFYDKEGKSKNVIVKGSESCGNCGCNLSLKTRCLTCSCPINKWSALLTEIDVDTHKEQLNDNI